MHVVLVEFRLKQGAAERFMPLMLHQAATSLASEAGCHRFDVCVDPAEARNVVLYEIYTDAAAFKTHLATPHFAEFNAAVSTLIDDKSVRQFECVTP